MLAIAALFVFVHAQTPANVCDGELMLFLPHPDRCQSFIMCMLETPVTMTCDPNFIWDQRQRRCRLGSHDTCQFRFGAEPSCEDVLFSIHYQYDTCTRFFMCMLGERINFTCGPGEIFEIYYRACVPGDDFLCIADAPTPYKQIENQA